MEFEFSKSEKSHVETPVVEEIKIEEVPVVEQLPVVEKVDIEEQPKKKVSVDGLVAIQSPKKVSWDGVGSLNIGINYVTKEEADKWLAAKHYVKLVEETNK